MKKSALAVLSATLLLVSMMPLGAQAHNDKKFVDAKTMSENGRQVKVFEIGAIHNHRCDLSDDAVLKFYDDGSLQFDGKVQCREGYGKDEDGVEIETDFLTSARDRQLFDKEFSRDIFTRNQWIEWKAQELGNARLAGKWNQVDKIRIDLDH